MVQLIDSQQCAPIIPGGNGDYQEKENASGLSKAVAALFYEETLTGAQCSTLKITKTREQETQRTGSQEGLERVEHGCTE